MKAAPQLLQVALELGPLLPEFVFTGGLVIPLYLGDDHPFSIRFTDDADVVFACTRKRDFDAMQVQLTRLGFTFDGESSVICRMKSPSGFTVDVLPSDTSVIGFENAWFGHGFANAIETTLEGGLTLRLFHPVDALCAKVAAHQSRGVADPILSQDLEDLLRILVFRPGLADELASASALAQSFLRAFLRDFLAQSDLGELLEAHVPRHSARAQQTLNALLGVLGSG